MHVQIKKGKRMRKNIKIGREKDKEFSKNTSLSNTENKNQINIIKGIRNNSFKIRSKVKTNQ